MTTIQIVSDWPATDPYIKILRNLREREFPQISGLMFLGPDSPIEPDPVLLAGAPPEWWVPGEHQVIPVPSFRETMFTAGGVTKLEHGLRLLLHGTDVALDYEWRRVANHRLPPAITGHRMAVDIEVSGDIEEDEPEDCQLISVAVCWQEGDEEFIWVWDLDALADALCLDRLAFLLDNNKLIMHNGKFDSRWLMVYLADLLHKPLYFDEDTQGMHYCMFMGAGEHDLKSLAHRIFGAPDWEAEIKKYTKGSKGHYERIPTNILSQYNAGDVHWTYALFIRLNHWLDMNPDARHLYESLWKPMTWMYQDIESHGMHIDTEYATELDEHFTDLTATLLSRLRSIVGDPAQIFTPETYNAKLMPKVFNPGSPKQLLHVLHSQGYKVANTAEDTLVTIRQDIDRYLDRGLPDITPLIDPLLEYRHATKAHSTYVQAVLRRARHDFIHPQFLTARTSTGRTASKSPNVQNVSNDEEGQLSLRKMYDAAPGMVLVGADFAQAELRVMAELSNDEKMIAALQEDAPDFFDGMMPLIWPGVDFTDMDKVVKKGMRLRLKRVVYGSSYGLTAKSVAYLLTVQANTPTTEAEAEHIQDGYLGIFPGLRQWRENRMNEFMTHGLVTPFGRRFQQDYVSHGNFLRVQNQAWAFSPQSIASDICVTAAIDLHNTIRKHFSPTEAHLIATVHDAITAQTQPDIAELIAGWMTEKMRLAGAKIYQRVPFLAEAKIGRNWSEV